MSLDFNLQDVETVEFGVGKDVRDTQEFTLVPVDGAVQDALIEMAADTWDQLERMEDGAEPYEASEKHGSKEYRTLDLDDEMVAELKELHEAKNMKTNSATLREPATVFCYFARFTDSDGKKLTAVRRAAQFKGILNSRLIRIFTDTMTMVEDKIFKLDTEFDFLIDDQMIHILRPTGFEFVGGLSQAILDAVSGNITKIKGDLPYVELAGVEEYAKTHPRAARYLASIRSSNQSVGVKQTALLKLCKETGVAVAVKKSRLHIDQGNELGFLEVLDRRRYRLELVDGSPEKYRAASRSKLGGG